MAFRVNYVKGLGGWGGRGRGAPVDNSPTVNNRTSEVRTSGTSPLRGRPANGPRRGGQAPADGGSWSTAAHVATGRPTRDRRALRPTLLRGGRRGIVAHCGLRCYAAADAGSSRTAAHAAM